MRRTTLFHTTLNILVASFFVLIGVFCLIVPWVGSLQRAAVEFFLSSRINMSVWALGFLGVGLSMLSTQIRQKRQYYHLKTGNRAVLVSQSILDQYVSDYWEHYFPDQEFVSNVKIKNHQIHITADLPPLPFDSQREFLQKAEHDLADLLQEKAGYERSFSLSISFLDQKPLLKQPF